MMTPMEFMLVVIAVLGFFYWVDALRAKEQARRAGKQRCQEAGVNFLDDSVVLRRLGFRQPGSRRIAFYRKYSFEFSSDGSIRYRGEIELLNKQVHAVSMEPYRIPDTN
jgi:hypothetical protein